MPDRRKIIYNSQWCIRKNILFLDFIQLLKTLLLTLLFLTSFYFNSYILNSIRQIISNLFVTEYYSTIQKIDLLSFNFNARTPKQGASPVANQFVQTCWNKKIARRIEPVYVEGDSDRWQLLPQILFSGYLARARTCLSLAGNQVISGCLSVDWLDARNFGWKSSDYWESRFM